MRYLSMISPYILVLALLINQMQQGRAQIASQFVNLRDVPATRVDIPPKPRPWDTDVVVLRDSITAHAGRAIIGFKAPVQPMKFLVIILMIWTLVQLRLFKLGVLKLMKFMMDGYIGKA